ncbi:hypothetical protein F5148DRAFT_1374614 [Russula earlei]|uniref:Uncharacterized protein n=1 Tax=Russula earlei TaxID=71964 RepID=A0ACC0UF43_9AGAM|nr:hypothetical protein F5148DRAFT_1374614 [Russula earlei]
MADINTWRDLLLPTCQDVRVRFRQFCETPVPAVVQTSSFKPVLWNPMRLPASVRLVVGLPAMMQGHLGDIINESYSGTAAGTSFLDDDIGLITPQSVLYQLRLNCLRTIFLTNSEPSSGVIAQYLSNLVGDIYRALTNNVLEFRSQEPSLNRTVITDHSYRLNDAIKILWEDKSPQVFNKFMRELMTQLRPDEVLNLYQDSSDKYTGYEAILGKLVYHAGDVDLDGSPRHIRWAVIFSGLHYTIMYIPRTPGRPRVYCSPIAKFCLPPGDDEGQLPPIWSMLVYMLLTDVRDIDDDTLMQRFGLDLPTEDSSLSPEGRQKTEDGMRSARLQSKGGGSSAGPSNVPTGNRANIVIQCLDGLPIEFTLVDAPLPQLAKKMCRQFIHFDHYLGGGWSSVYASRKWRVVVKFAAVPKKDKAMLERQLSNETAVYHKLSRIAGWVVPLHYGEYKWDGGRAIILSDEGRSLSHLETFTSLSFVERLIIFWELYCIHLLGVEHGDLEPRNVLQKWSRFPKIIDFGFANVNHSCPGWNQCEELKDVLRKVGLDKVDLWLKCRVLEKITLLTGTDHHRLPLMIFIFILLIMKWTF